MFPRLPAVLPALAACAAGLLLLTPGLPADSPAPAADPAKVPADLRAQQEQNAKLFAKFKTGLLRLAQKLQRSDRPEDQDRAKVILAALDVAAKENVDTQFQKLVAGMTQGTGNLNAVGKLIQDDRQLVQAIQEILTVLSTDDETARLKAEIERLKEYIKEAKDIKRAQEIERALNEIKKNDPNRLAKAQKDLAERTQDLASKMGGKKADPGKETPGGKGGEKADPKAEPKAGGDPKAGDKAGEGKSDTQESQSDPKGGDPMKGDAGAEAKPGDKAGAEGKKGGPESAAEGKDGQPGEGKGAGDPKDGQGDPKGGDPKAGGDPKGGDPAGEPKGGDPKGGEPKPGDPKGGDGQGGDPKGGDPKGGQQPGGKKGDGGPPAGQPGGDKAGTPAKGGQGKGQGAGKGEAKAGGKGGEGKGSGAQPGQQAQGGGPKGGGSPPPGGGSPPPGGGSPGGPQAQQPPGRKEIQEAVPPQKDAAEDLKKDQRQQAGKGQDKAIQKLADAIKELEKRLKQLREEEALKRLANLEARCNRMLAMQIEVYEATKSIDAAVAKNNNQKTTPDIQKAQKEAEKEKEIMTEADKALKLLEGEGSAVAFAKVLEEVREDMIAVQRRLADARVDKDTQGIEENIIAMLKDMVLALKKAQQEMQQSQGQPPPPGKPGNQPLIDLLAELKLIKALQTQVNARTTMYGNKEKAEQATDPILREEIRQLSARQAKLQDMINKIANGSNR